MTILTASGDFDIATHKDAHAHCGPFIKLLGTGVFYVGEFYLDPNGVLKSKGTSY